MVFGGKGIDWRAPLYIRGGTVVLILLLAATYSQIITAYTIPFDTQDSTDLIDTTIAQIPTYPDNIQPVKFEDRLSPLERQYAEPRGACKGYDGVIHVTCEGPEVDFDPPVNQNFYVVLNCDGGEFDVFFFYFFPFHEIPSFASIGIPIHDRYLRNKVG